jgi:biopolymer transport protein ExbD
MAMSVGSGDGDVMCDINTTPLIDVMLVLLVTIILSVPVMMHAVKLDMPPPRPDQPPPPVPPEIIDLSVDFDGTVLWNGNPVNSLNDLDALFKQEEVKDPQPEIHLRPDRLAKYDVVAKVLATAQHDHMSKIGFVNITDFGSEN